MLLPVAIHLEGDINFFLEPVGLRGVVGVDVIALIGNIKADVVHLLSHPFEAPYEMNPGLRRKVIARNGSGSPNTIERIPDIPVMSVVEVTLRSPGPAGATEGLIDVKLEGLWRISIVNVEPEVVCEVGRGSTTTQWNPIELN